MRRRGYQFTYKRKVALKKAQLVSARKRKRMAMGVLGVGVAIGAVYAGSRVYKRKNNNVAAQVKSLNPPQAQLDRAGKPSPRMWDGSKIPPMGKNVVLYHRTTSRRARNILRTGTWKPGEHAGNYIFFSHGGVTPEEHIKGKTVLSVTVPRSRIFREFHLIDGITYYMINQEDLQGQKIRRVN